MEVDAPSSILRVRTGYLLDLRPNESLWRSCHATAEELARWSSA